MRRPEADLMLLGTVTLWAFNFTVSKYILDQGFQPLAYASVRYA
jgi:drug/metabolite transporter (DMT)-like permease